jgi:hypothetical protein
MRALSRFVFFIIAIFSSVGTPPPLTQEKHQQYENGLEFTSEAMEPGSVIAVRLKNPDDRDNPFRACFRRQCFKLTHQWELLPTDSDTVGPQLFIIEDHHSRWAFEKLNLNVSMFEKIKMKITNLRLPSTVADYIKSNDQAVEFEKAFNSFIYTRYSPKEWSHEWKLPIASKITSLFGSIRIAEGRIPYTHKGLDLRARTGTEVTAASDGWVVATLHQVVSGNVITIDHGRGVMSRYLHLSEFKVGIAEEVKAGQVIGLSGTSGRSEAPHLHWEIRVRGYPVEPRSTARLLARLSQS